jgi:hypothetical protein
MSTQQIVGLIAIGIAIILTRSLVKRIDNNDVPYEDIGWMGWGVGIGLLSFLVGLFANGIVGSKLAEDQHLSDKKQALYRKKFFRGVLIGLTLNIAQLIIGFVLILS